MRTRSTRQSAIRIQDLKVRLGEHKEGKLHLEGEGATALGGWFLGPKAENEALLLELVKAAVERHCRDRRSYFPDDPEWLTEERKNSPGYIEGVKLLKERFFDLLGELDGSVPFFSHRYQGHMLWDVTLPAVAGYFAAMLYNQNNVAAEASPVTTWLEMLVGDDLCRMLGYYVPKRKADGTYEDAPADKTIAWGHITCDGSVANAEAVWAARNLKFIPIGIAAALRNVEALAPGRGLSVRLAHGEERVIVELSTWELLNLPIDEVLALETRLESSYRYEPGVDVEAIVASYKIENAGISAFLRRYAPTSQDPVLITPATAHYSWPKAMSLLGLGRDSTIQVYVDLDARLDMQDLRRKLDACLRDQRPIIAVVVVLGTTEESAVDPLADILAERERYRQLGLEFWVHVDAAWGGYFASMLRPSDGGAMKSNQPQTPHLDEQFAAARVPDPHEVLFGPHLVMSAYVRKQYAALGQSDSITVDPHKAGYVPYPAGGLCYRDARMRNLVAFTAPVVYHGGIDPTVGVYGVEGSKPGAAAAAVYLSHRVIRTDKTGYGRILGRCMWNSKRLYCALVSMAGADDRFRIKAFQRLPSERVEQPEVSEIEQELARIRAEIVPRTNQELLDALNESPELFAWFETLGSDQVIVSYAFNFVRKDGTLNADAHAMNELNQEIFRRLSLASYRDGIPDVPLFLTASNFDPAVYGTQLIHSFQRRLGAEPCDIPLDFLLSTTMNPWLTDTRDGNFIPRIVEALRSTVMDILESEPKFA